MYVDHLPEQIPYKLKRGASHLYPFSGKTPVLEGKGKGPR